MVYARKTKSKISRKRTYKRKPSSALSYAKKALSTVKNLTRTITRPVFYCQSHALDLAGTGGAIGNNCYEYLLTKPQGTIAFAEDGVTGDKARCDWAKIDYMITNTNLNNEEETINYTVSVIKFKKDYYNNANLVYLANGMVFWNPALVQVLAQRRHTLTMGSTSPGTAGESTVRSSMFIKIGKQIRFQTKGSITTQSSNPMDDADQVWFMIHTDNSGVDTESGRLNALSTVKWTDLDVNH